MSSDQDVAAWATAAWREQARDWIDGRLAEAGCTRTGEVEQPRLRPWGTVLRAPTDRGPVWLKAGAPATAFEAGLYELLVRTVPDHVLTPIAVDAPRGWVLLPDGGPSLRELGDDTKRSDLVAAALAQYAALQRALTPHVDELLALGVADMRPPLMPRRFDEALAAAEAEHEQVADGAALVRRLERMRPTVSGWCERLAQSPPGASLDHNDLHAWNILPRPGGHFRYYDWGDAVVAHPFAVMLVPLAMAERAPGGAERPRDAYLEVFGDLAPRAELAETLSLACRVAKIARALTWERALRSAREQGETLDEFFAAAPLKMLASLLEDSWRGAA
jgi:Phosphotransferase enzyme family